MKIVKPKVELITQSPGLLGIYEAIARAGRICYASESQRGNQAFVSRLVEAHHYRPLEFGTVYLKMSDGKFYRKNPYSMVKHIKGMDYVTTNYRVIIENDKIHDLNWLVEPTEHHYKRYTFHWTIARSIADEMRTHCTISSLMQSTRYCDYSKDKFGSSLTFIEPSESLQNKLAYKVIKCVWKVSEIAYKWLVRHGIKAQRARSVLPLDIKTEFIQCAFAKDWENFFDQRYKGTTGAPHPDCKFIAEQAYQLWEQRDNQN